MTPRWSPTSSANGSTACGAHRPPSTHRRRWRASENRSEPPMRMLSSMLRLLAAAVVSTAATAAELSSVTMADDVTIIALGGDVAEGDTEAAEALIKTANDADRLISAVRLDSAGGSLAEAVKLAA